MWILNAEVVMARDITPGLWLHMLRPKGWTGWVVIDLQALQAANMFLRLYYQLSTSYIYSDHLLLNTFHQFMSVGLRKESGCMSRLQAENVMVVWGSGRRGPYGQRRDERELQLQVQLQQWNLTWLSPCQKPCQRNKLSSKTFSTAKVWNLEDYFSVC